MSDINSHSSPKLINIQLQTRQNYGSGQNHYAIPDTGYRPTESRLLTPTIYKPVTHTTSYYASSHIDQTNSATETSSIGRKKRGVAGESILWPQHSTVKISFIGMTKEQERFTKENINKWAPHVNLKFEFTDKPDGDIRIKADNNFKNGWSRIGTVAKSFPSDSHTMLIGFAKSEGSHTAAVIQHEFGHALGLLHEHQHPDNNLDFNHERLYQIAEEKGKSRRDVDYNVLRKYDPADVTTSKYDQKSIMHYPFRRSSLNSGKEITRNFELSAGDISFARSLYPPKSATPVNPGKCPRPLKNPFNPSTS